jgi:fibronectin-binding autotransporter adhesin
MSIDGYRGGTPRSGMAITRRLLGVSVASLALAGVALSPAAAQVRDLGGATVTGVGFGPFSVYTNGTFQANVSGAGETYAGGMNDSGGVFALTKIGVGTLTLTGSGLNTYSGQTTVSTRVLRAGASDVFSPNSRLRINSGSVDLNGFDQRIAGLAGTGAIESGVGAPLLTIENSGGTNSHSGVISGGVKIIKNGAGVQNLAGASSFTGGVVVNGGTLGYGSDLAFGTGAITFNSAATFSPINNGRIIANNISLGAQITYSGVASTLAGVISGAGGITKVGTSILTLTNTRNDFSGGILLAAGQIDFSDGSLGTGTITTTTRQVTLATLDASAEIDNNIVLGGQMNFELPEAPGDLGLLGTISGNGSLFLKTGTGMLKLTGVNSYTGGTLLGVGSLGLQDSASAGTGSITFAGSTRGLVALADNLDIANSLRTRVNAGIDTGSFDMTLSGVISDVDAVNIGGLNKLGTGTLTLTGASTYTGMTTVSAGRLDVDGSIVSATTVNSGATLGGNGSVAGPVTILDGGILSPGKSAGTLTVGALTLNNASVLDWEFGAANSIGGASNDLVIVNGNLVLDGVLNVAQTAGGNFSAGIYQIFQYSGTLTDNILTFGSPLPNGLTGLVQAGLVPGQVNLIMTGSPALVLLWDGADGVGNGVASGGSGTWSALSSNWTGAAPSMINTNWQSTIGVFQGTAGTVAIDGPQAFDMLQFAIDGYTLAAGAAGSLTTAGAGVLFAATGANASIAAPITGAGSIVKQGGGSVTFTAGNSYAGGTNLQLGTIIVGNNNALGAGALLMAGGTKLSAGANNLTLANAITTAGAGTIDQGTGAFTLAGPISGAGSLATVNSGNLILNGNNSFGGLSVGAGTVTVGSNTAAGAGTIAMAGGTTLSAGANNLTLANAVTTAGVGTIDTGANTFTLSGPISGAGSLSKVGTGALNLTAANTYAGGTILNAGTVGFANAAALGAGATTVNSGVLLANANNLSLANLINFAGAGAIDTAANALTVSGVASGSGRITKLGTGTLTLTGANTFTGGTTITAGTLVGSVASLGSGGILNNAALVINQPTDATLNQVISGTGSVTKQGAGTLAIASVNTVTGPTTVTAGRLNVTGSLANSAVTLQTGTALAGTGTVGALTAQSGSTVSPGATTGSIATLTVNGALNLAAGSTLAIDINPNAADRVTATGAATTAGNLTVTVAGLPFTNFNQSYTLVSGSSRTGTFATTSLGNYGPAFAPVLIYDATSVILRFAPNSLVTLGGSNLAPNPLAVANAFDTAVRAGYNPQPFFALYTQGANLPSALNELSGELRSAERRAILDDTRVVRETAFDRLNAGLSAVAGSTSVTSENEGKSTTFWLRAAGSWGTARADGVGSRFTTEQRGVLTGIDFATNGFKVGGMFHYTNTDLELGSLGSSTLESVGGAVYGGYRQDGAGFAIGGGGSIASSNADGSRAITAPGLGQTLNGQVDGVSYQLFGEIAFDLVKADNSRIEPFVRAAYVKVDSKAFAETGGIAGVTGIAQSSDATLTTLGMRAAFTTGMATLSGSAGWQRTTGDRGAASILVIPGVNTPYSVSTVSLDKDAVALEALASYAVSQKITLGVSYSGVIGDNNTNHGARATLTVGF